MDQRAELNAELRKARGWLIAVGILMFVMDLLYLFVINKGAFDDDTIRMVVMISAGVMVAFFALAFFLSRAPKLCMILGLVLFWGIALFNVREDPSQITKGLLIKIFFTVALVRGLQNANRAEFLKKDLERVFE
ncbi:MAG: hypothetical protein H6709_24065 [Kofleriaceae bacterium]|nr:hypothetical protein [Myxococcales bacterium]MCB9560666.1 hypothetical protein [Kofleriaceae bacterium]MCB9575164.1 hypothetical protein [Kofleriaceae bacterium]